MKLYISNKNESIRVFRNSFLEFFTHANPLTPVIVYLPIVIYLIYVSYSVIPLVSLAGLFCLGILIWSFSEYVIHRWIFHLESDTAIGKKLYLIFHKTHHDYPRDSTRLVMPLVVSIPLGLLFYAAFITVFSGYTNIIYAGLLLGYIFYDSIHYIVHSKKPVSRVGKYLKHYHILHHYYDYHTAFGVSSPLWDYVFRTMPPKSDERVRLNRNYKY